MTTTDLRSAWKPQAEALMALSDLASSFANVLAADNDNFDRVRFLEACGFAPTTKEGSS